MELASHNQYFLSEIYIAPELQFKKVGKGKSKFFLVFK
jgi:hypothetical protein